MSIELKIPDVGESVREVQIGRWLKGEGDSVGQDENLVELETDKASMELPAPAAGVMGKILKREGDIVAVGEVIGYLEKSDAAPRAKAISQGPTQAPSLSHENQGERQRVEARNNKQHGDKTDRTPVAATAEQREKKLNEPAQEIPITPSARRALREHGLTVADIDPKGTRIDREDVLRYVEERQTNKSAGVQIERQETEEKAKVRGDEELEEIVPMSLIRRRIAERLVHAQQRAALLTTFNEIDMTAVKQLREVYREPFQKKYGVKLGFMSFFVKAVVDALQGHPELNAEIRDDEIAYRHYCHIGIAVGSAKGLVVPVLRFAERLSFAEIEQAIDDFARRAAVNKLEPQELDGGTFTITNGGVYGSLLSTPIVNPPQSGIFGMHAIQERPVACAGQVVIRPMMYVALTYDHRLVDGREAVSFLKRIKDGIEDPPRMMLEI